MIQAQTINYLLSSKDTSLIVLNNLTKDYFPEYSAEFSYIYNHYQQYNTIPDKETFLSIFPDFDLIDVQEPASYLINELFKEHQTQQIAKAFNSIREPLMAGNTEKAIEILKKANESVSAGIVLNSIDITKNTSRYDAYVDKTKNLDKYFISTGFKEIDERLGGWDRLEELGVVIARTGQGKSWLLIKFAAAAVEQGLNVGLYSGEMSENKVGYRFDTLVGHVSNGALTHGNVIAMDEYTKYINELPTKYKGSLKVLTPAMIGGLASVTTLRAFIEKEHLDILFIDQHSLLIDDRHARNPIEKAANISTDLKTLQVLKKIPIISVCQMNRGNGEKKTGESDIGTDRVAGSDKIDQDATIIIGLERDKKDPSLLKMHFVKTRDATNTDPISYLIDLNKGQFTYIPETEVEAEEQVKGKQRVGEEGTVVF